MNLTRVMKTKEFSFSEAQMPGRARLLKRPKMMNPYLTVSPVQLAAGVT